MKPKLKLVVEVLRLLPTAAPARLHAAASAYNTAIGPWGEARRGERRIRRGLGRGRRLHADSGSLALLASAQRVRALRLALHMLEAPSNFLGAAHRELAPLPLLDGLRQVRHLMTRRPKSKHDKTKSTQN